VVSFLDGAAVVAALFFGLVPRSGSTTPHIAVAQAAPSQTARALLALTEETKAREVANAAARNTKALVAQAHKAKQAAAKASRTRKTQARQARQAAAKATAAQTRQGREAKHAATQRATALRRGGAANGKPKRTPKPKLAAKRQKPNSKSEHASESHAQARAERRLERQQSAERRSGARSQREAAHQGAKWQAQERREPGHRRASFHSFEHISIYAEPKNGPRHLLAA
jgi:colicin import membrane protein